MDLDLSKPSAHILLSSGDLEIYTFIRLHVRVYILRGDILRINQAPLWNSPKVLSSNAAYNTGYVCLGSFDCEYEMWCSSPLCRIVKMVLNVGSNRDRHLGSHLIQRSVLYEKRQYHHPSKLMIKGSSFVILWRPCSSRWLVEIGK